MNSDHIIFLQLWTGGEGSETEVSRILDRLRVDEDFRVECVAEVDLLGMCRTAQSSKPRWLDLAEELGLEEESRTSDSDAFAQEVMAQVSKYVPRRRPLTAAVAGLLLGLFGASVVWAVAWSGLGSMDHEVLLEGFESRGVIIEQKFPERAGVWNGNKAVVVESESAAEGQFVLRFEPWRERGMSHINHLLDVSALPELMEKEERELHLILKVRAVENVISRHRFNLRLAAFAEESSGVREKWFTGDYLSEQALTLASRSRKVNQEGWVTLEATLPLPPESQNVVISLGVKSTEEAKAGVWYEVDGFRLELITSKGK